MNRSECALFWMLTAKSQAALMQWHWDTFGTKLNIPPAPGIKVEYEAVPEELEDLEKIMQEAPQHQRRVD